MSTTQTTKVKMNSEVQDRPDRPTGERPEWLERLLGYPRRAQKFLQEVRAEMKLVVWPSWSEVRSTTLVVIMTTILFALFLWGVDKISERGVSIVTRYFRPHY
jgi:preprotein translocase SecE subunit